jgi:two-component system LytT family response regulator/two-component system response regulator LytT
MKQRSETQTPPVPAPVPAPAGGPAAATAVAAPGGTTGRLRAVVVDDEPPAREELVHLLAAIPAVEVVGEAANGVEAIELIESKHPDLAFLDIRMPGLDGFQVVRHLSRRQLVPQIIFVTAYDQYAIRAFEVSATDYLLKPVERKRLSAAIDKVKGRVGKVEAPPSLETLLGAIAARRGGHLSRIPVRRGERLGLVDAQALIYAYIADGTVYVVAGGASEATSYRTLEELEADLDPTVFMRVHRSYLANINKVTEIIPWFSGTYRLKMQDKAATEIPLSRAQAKKLRKLLKW